MQESEGGGGLLVRGLGKSEVFVPQQFKTEAQFQAVQSRVQDELRATMMDCYLHSEFQHSLERAQALLD